MDGVSVSEGGGEKEWLKKEGRGDRHEIIRMGVEGAGKGRVGKWERGRRKGKEGGEERG